MILMQTNYTIKTLDLIDCFVNFESKTAARSRVKHKQKLAMERQNVRTTCNWKPYWCICSGMNRNGPRLSRNCYFVFYFMIQPDLETTSV